MSDIRHVMDQIGSSESELNFDLESGGTETASEEYRSEESGSDGKYYKKILSRSRSGYVFVDGSITASDGIGASKNVLDIGENMDMEEGGMENPMVEKQKKKSSKHPKPPRPPTGPSLGAADIELVKQISTRTRLRRARRQRMKKKMKSDKASSSNITIIAMIITAFFFFVIIFQGILGARV